ncbi:hypothetical protein R6Q59_012415 [Mikania micrantha]
MGFHKQILKQPILAYSPMMHQQVIFTFWLQSVVFSSTYALVEDMLDLIHGLLQRKLQLLQKFDVLNDKAWDEYNLIDVLNDKAWDEDYKRLFGGTICALRATGGNYAYQHIYIRLL